MTLVPGLGSQTSVAVPAAREDRGVRAEKPPQRRTMSAARLTRPASAKIVIWGLGCEKHANTSGRTGKWSHCRRVFPKGAGFQDVFSLRSNGLRGHPQ